jgi:hypothetical protein
MIGHIPLISKDLRDIFEKTVRRVGPINFELRLRDGARSKEAGCKGAMYIQISFVLNESISIIFRGREREPLPPKIVEDLRPLTLLNSSGIIVLWETFPTLRCLAEQRHVDRLM